MINYLVDSKARADINDIVQQTIGLSSELLSGETINPSQALEEFLNSCNNKKVVFPSGRTIVLERQLVIHNVENLEIDFNGSTIKLPDNCAWEFRYDTGEYVPLSAITIHSASNIVISNYIIDGNSSNISPDQWCIGLWLSNINGFISNNGAFKYCNYHHIVIDGGTKNIKFYDTHFKDHGGASKPAGISDVFITNSPDDDFTFINTFVDNTALRDRQAQCFYVSGYNGIIQNFRSINCAVPLDVRCGTHFAKDFFIKNAEQVLIMQSNPSSEENPSLTASNFVGENILGNQTGATGLYIIACDKCHLNDFSFEMATVSDYIWYGARIRNLSDRPMKNINLNNIIIKNFTSAGIFMEDLVESVLLKNITLIGIEDSTINGIKQTGCEAYQFIENLDVINCYHFINDTDSIFQYRNRNYNLGGSTDNRPALVDYIDYGVLYVDSDLGKIIWRDDFNWVTTMGNFVSAPLNSTSNGTKGDFSADADYFYVCYDDDTWIRIAKSTW